jgi:hypothetical protein
MCSDPGYLAASNKSYPNQLQGILFQTAYASTPGLFGVSWAGESKVIVNCFYNAAACESTAGLHELRRSSSSTKKILKPDKSNIQ